MIIFSSLAVLTVLYIILLIYLGNGLNQLKKQKQSIKLPAVSVIVCSHNEENNLPDCIEHLKAQQYPAGQVEFILADDRSTDGTANIIQQAVSHDKRFRAVEVSDRIKDFAPKKRAIDLALKQSTGEIICLTDADGRPGPKWLKSMVSYFTEDTDMVIGYAPYSVKHGGIFSKKLLALEYLSHAAVAAASTGRGYPATCVGTNMAYRKKLYTEIGGFGKYKSYISGDDDLFLTRVRDADKYQIKYASISDSHVYNNPPELWSKFLHQRMRYASKGLHYTFGMSLMLLIYYLFNLLFAAVFILSAWKPGLLAPSLALIGMKWGVEYWIMSRAGAVLNDRRNLALFPAAALLHIPYVLVFGFLGQFNHFRWAEEKAETGIQEIPQEIKN